MEIVPMFQIVAGVRQDIIADKKKNFFRINELCV